MTAHFKSPLATWAFLLAATLLSYATWDTPGSFEARIAGTIVIALGLAKAWLIGRRFMEIGEAIWPLQLIFNLWVIAVGSVLTTLFWLAP